MRKNLRWICRHGLVGLAGVGLGMGSRVGWHFRALVHQLVWVLVWAWVQELKYSITKGMGKDPMEGGRGILPPQIVEVLIFTKSYVFRIPQCLVFHGLYSGWGVGECRQWGRFVKGDTE